MKRRALSRRYGRARRRVSPPMPDMSWLHGGPSGSLHERAAAALGWSVPQTQSISMHALRDLVRPVNPALANEMSEAIRSGRYIVGSR